jgi:hypothetical protein
MGRVHTAPRSRLGVEKVRKTTMVGMEITRSHMEAGLLRPRGRRHLDAFATNSEPEAVADVDTVSSDTDIGDLGLDAEVTDDPLDFERLAARLVSGAAEDVDSDSDDDEPDTELPPTPLPIPATSGAQTRCAASRSAVIPAALAPAPAPSPTSQPQASRTQKRKTQIPLKTLFIYPTDPNAPLNGLDDFWKGGIKNLESESEVLEILSAGGEDSSGPQVGDDTQMASVDSV